MQLIFKNTILKHTVVQMIVSNKPHIRRDTYIISTLYGGEFSHFQIEMHLFSQKWSIWCIDAACLFLLKGSYHNRLIWFSWQRCTLIFMAIINSIGGLIQMGKLGAGKIRIISQFGNRKIVPLLTRGPLLSSSLGKLM